MIFLNLDFDVDSAERWGQETQSALDRIGRKRNASDYTWGKSHYELFPQERILEVATVAEGEDRHKNDEPPVVGASSRIAPNVVQWHWNGNPPPLDEMLNVLDVAAQNPHYRKFLFTENKAAVLKSVGNLFKQQGIDIHGIDMHRPGELMGPSTLDKLLEDKYGITFKDPRELFKKPWPKPSFNLDWTESKDVTDERMERARKKLSLLHIQEGSGITANYAAKCNILRLVSLYLYGGLYVDTDVPMKDRESRLPTNMVIPNGVLFSDYAVAGNTEEKFADPQWRLTHPGAHKDPYKEGEGKGAELRDFANNIMFAPKHSPVILDLILNMVENPNAYPRTLNDAFAAYKNGYQPNHAFMLDPLVANDGTRILRAT